MSVTVGAQGYTMIELSELLRQAGEGKNDLADVNESGPHSGDNEGSVTNLSPRELVLTCVCSIHRRFESETRRPVSLL